MSVKLNEKYVRRFVSDDAVEGIRPQVEQALETVKTGSGLGADFLGWRTRPVDYDKEEYARVLAAAERIRKSCDVFVVIGIGGSYLGARAVLEVFPSDGPEICFLGCSLSPNEIQKAIKKLEGKDWSINVISKSGGTTEPAVAFRVFRDLLVKQYGKDADARIYATTDKARGALKSLADSNGWETFVVPDDVGGRYSVLTAVGLLPIAAAGVDISELMGGAHDAMVAYDKRDMSNPVWQYAAARNLLYRQGKKIELFCVYEPSYSFVGEWLKQLFGESEGKEGKALFPASAQFTTDLHSLGQYIQEGERDLFETVVYVDDTGCDIAIPYSDDNGDNLNYLAGKPLSFVREMAFRGTLAAHRDGGAPSVVLRLDKMDVRALGELLYFFELSCGISGHILGINPFDQPGVEAYKKNMFALLGKP